MWEVASGPDPKISSQVKFRVKRAGNNPMPIIKPPLPLLFPNNPPFSPLKFWFGIGPYLYPAGLFGILLVSFFFLKSNNDLLLWLTLDLHCSLLLYILEWVFLCWFPTCRLGTVESLWVNSSIKRCISSSRDDRNLTLQVHWQFPSIYCTRTLDLQGYYLPLVVVF